MTRRLVLAAVALSTIGGFAAPALASSGDGRHEVCVMGTNGPNSQGEGICVWIPTN
jgi:hypothetical protein